MREERPWSEEYTTDIQSRIQNLLWTVSQNYEAEADIDIAACLKSKYIAFYDTILQGMFQKYFDSDKFNRYLTRRVYQGVEPSVFLAIAKLCIDSAVHKKAKAERPGVANIRKRAFRDTLNKDALRLSHTDWGHLEYCYLCYILYKDTTDSRMQPFIEKITDLSQNASTEDICRCTDEIYRAAYEKGFAKFFKGLDRHVKNTDENKKDYSEKDSADEEDSARETQKEISLFSGHVDAQDNGQDRKKAAVIIPDSRSAAHMEEYIEKNYGKCSMTPLELKHFQSRICKGIHKDCRLHITKGILHSDIKENAKTEYVKRVREANLQVYEKNFLVTRQNIQVLANTLKRALLTRTEREVCASEYGNICVNKLWNIGRTDNRRLFQRELFKDNSDFAVEVLIDSSGSQQRRQSLVALQGYIISEALSMAGIPHRVTGFCTFGDYTILNQYRDYDDEREMNQRIFEFYGSANNRDGLAVRAAADSLDMQPQENKILIVLSDGRPNDIIAGSVRKKEKKEPYCLEYAVKDTASEIRRLRNRKISVLGVFAGEEEDLPGEKKIFGKDFAYIRDISDFAHVVGRYLRKQIGE